MVTEGLVRPLQYCVQKPDKATREHLVALLCLEVGLWCRRQDDKRGSARTPCETTGRRRGRPRCSAQV